VATTTTMSSSCSSVASTGASNSGDGGTVAAPLDPVVVAVAVDPLSPSRIRSLSPPSSQLRRCRPRQRADLGCQQPDLVGQHHLHVTAACLSRRRLGFLPTAVGLLPATRSRVEGEIAGAVAVSTSAPSPQRVAWLRLPTKSWRGAKKAATPSKGTRYIVESQRGRKSERSSVRG
jgi:hypothetical protein